VRFLVRASGDPAPLVQPVRRSLRDAIPGLVVTNTFTLDQVRAVAGKETAAGTAPFFPLIVIGMLLMSSGLYGVLAFAVSRRTRELADQDGHRRRLAHAGQTGHGRRACVSWRSGRPLGIALTFGLSRLVRATGGEGFALRSAVAGRSCCPGFIVLVVALLATWVPARRALRVNPARLLRST
jgi:hypothetical protein